MKTQLVRAVVIQHHPVSHDVKHFPEILKQMTRVTDPWIFVLDKGYDSESVYQMILKKECNIHDSHKKQRLSD